MAEGGATYSDDPVPSSSTAEPGNEEPICVIVLGMAGSGKTTFVKRLTAHLFAKQEAPYVVNLDPAVKSVPYPANVDICDTLNYKEVMKEYKLGPNGAIMTCLNLFSTRFDQLMDLLKKRKSETKYVIIDTPGQIEVFTWSASGTIITETLASTFPTVIAYVMDSARSTSPVTFMSNMLYACSILYKTKLPFVILLNKADAVNPEFAIEWMKDFEKFHEALSEDSSYSSDLARSLSLALDDFYAGIEAIPISATTGVGFTEVVQAVTKAKDEYYKTYKPEYDRLLAEKRENDVNEQAKQLDRVKLDLQSEASNEDAGKTGGIFIGGKNTQGTME